MANAKRKEAIGNAAASGSFPPTVKQWLDEQLEVLVALGEGCEEHFSEKLMATIERWARNRPDGNSRLEVYNYLLLAGTEFNHGYYEELDRYRNSVSKMWHGYTAYAKRNFLSHYDFLSKKMEEKIISSEVDFKYNITNTFDRLTKSFIRGAEHYIDQSETDRLSATLNQLIEFVEQNYQRVGVGPSLADKCRELFPSANLNPPKSLIVSASIDLPETAPAHWATAKQPGDTPPAFIQRHYEPWLGKGLARPDIKRLDPQLYVALANWLRNNDMPADLDLPTLKEKNDRWVERIEAEGRPNMGELPAREASHIRNLLSRRRTQETQKQ